MTDLHLVGSEATMTTSSLGGQGGHGHLYLWQSGGLKAPGMADLELGVAVSDSPLATPHDLGALREMEHSPLVTGLATGDPGAYTLRRVHPAATPGRELDAAIALLEVLSEGTPESEPLEEEFGWRKNMLDALRSRRDGKAYVAVDPGEGDEGVTAYASTVSVQGLVLGAVPDDELFRAVALSEIPADANWVDGSMGTCLPSDAVH